VAFTSDELAKLRFVLGYASTPAWANTWLDSTMATVAAASPADQTLVRAQLAEITLIEAQLSEARGRLKADGLEGIKLRGREELQDLRREASLYAGAIGTVLSVEKVGDPYLGVSGGGALRVG
jgi:hypothetical protein